MSALDLFRYDNADVRVVMRDDEPWFVAGDICDYFEVGNRNRVMQLVDPEDKGGTQIDTPGGRQTFAVVNESGLYAVLFALQPTKARGIDDAVIEQRLERVRRFKRWVTHEVLPQIRKNGSYNAPTGISFEEMTAKVIAGLQERIEAAQARNAELEAPAAAWNDLAAAEGDLTITDAAKVLGRAGIATGPRKLYDWLEANRWIYKRAGVWHTMQTAQNAGYLVERLLDYRHPSGERRLGDPQIRITAKGLERLRDLLADERALTVVTA